MPNKKDVVSVKLNNLKQKMQKRLLLCDIKVLHTQFKGKFPDFPIGLSKFAELRPKWCVPAGSSDTHSVCVCTIHENFKVMIDAAKIIKFTRDLSYQVND